MIKVVNSMTNRAAEQRRLGELRDAERTVGLTMTLARWILQNHPRQPEAHLLLSEACFQMSKNARKREDYNAIEQALREALASARRAVSLDPRHKDAPHYVERILPRLALFDNRRAASN